MAAVVLADSIPRMEGGDVIGPATELLTLGSMAAVLLAAGLLAMAGAAVEGLAAERLLAAGLAVVGVVAVGLTARRLLAGGLAMAGVAAVGLVAEILAVGGVTARGTSGLAETGLTFRLAAAMALGEGLSFILTNFGEQVFKKKRTLQGAEGNRRSSESGRGISGYLNNPSVKLDAA